jgi:hypothetical protein
MYTVRQHARGLDRVVREIWDFDGVHGPAPISGSARAFLYNQSSNSAPPGSTVFPVPPVRWQEYHNAIVKNVHGDIPAMCACHAATISRVGK